MPILYMVIPCYNEQDVLPVTSKMFLDKMEALIEADKISDKSRILFVNDGSEDNTWTIIKELAKEDRHYIGISQSRNCGHQNHLLYWKDPLWSDPLSEDTFPRKGFESYHYVLFPKHIFRLLA